MLEQKLTQEPENSTWAAELTDLLLIDNRARWAIARQLTNPWAKLAALYLLIGDLQALDRLAKHHPQAAVGLGDLYAAEKDWERAIAEYRKAVTEQAADSLLTKLATAYQSAGRTREGVP